MASASAAAPPPTNGGVLKKGNVLEQWLDVKTTATSTGELVVSWNCDGLEADAMKWLSAFIEKEKPGVLCLNETHLSDEKTVATLKPFAGAYHILSNAHDPSRWHGVAMLIRKDLAFVPIAVSLGNCAVRSDNKTNDPAKGRILAVYLNSLDVRIVTTYVPNAGTGRTNPLRNLGYRTDSWDPAVAHFLEGQRKLSPTLWIGDINVAPADMDVTAPKTMARWAGFTTEERQSLDKLYFKTGNWVDVWRGKYPTLKQYSWHGRNNSKNGMRLDNAIASKDLVPRTALPFIGWSSGPNSPSPPSDHLPIGLTIHPSIHHQKSAAN
jgi:exodeoxyribonuclease III